MFVRKIGNKAVLMRPEYSSEAKRCFDRQAAKMLFDSPVITPEIEAILGPDELTTVREWVDKRNAEITEIATEETIESAAIQMNKIAAAIKKRSPSFSQAREIVEGLDAIKKALRAEGFTKKQFSNRQKRQEASDPRQRQIEEMLQ